MNTSQQRAASAQAEPRRTLRADFTAHTLRHAATAKQRSRTKQQLLSLMKGNAPMKSLKLLRTVPGAAMAFAVVATGSVGVYALTNWFSGDVTVKQNDSVFSVDLSQCKGNLPPGVTSSDRKNVQFKILSDPHIAATDLQRTLLAQCEYNAVLAFYSTQPGMKDHPLYGYVSGSVKSVEGKTVTLQYLWSGKTVEQAFTLNNDATVFNQGQAIALQELHAGDKVIFAAQQQGDPQEGRAPTNVRSIFKTQYDTNEAPEATKKGFYEEHHIMPLDQYNKIHKQ